MKQNIPWEQLAKYFAGELTEEEHQKIESWINANPERKQQVWKLYEIWKESGHSPYQLGVDEAWKKLSANMDELEQKSRQMNRALKSITGIHKERHSTQNYRTGRKPGNTVRFIFIAAAAATILLTVGFLAYHYNLGRESQEVAEIAKKELTAKWGERATYVLNDGSKVILHAGSHLEVPLNYNSNKRELFLEGEAYFEVSHNPEKPFIVHSKQAYSRVLGTKFLVQAWSDSSNEVDVVVSEGRVALGNSKSLSGDSADRKREVILTQNQRGVLIGDKQPIVTNDVNLDWYLGWTQGRLVFQNRPFKQIIPLLEHWYALDIKLLDRSIGEKKLTAEIDYDQPMGEVLKGMALSLDLHLEREGRTATFRLKKEDE